MKKLISSILLIGILFSGFSSVQAEEVVEKPTVQITYEIWNSEGPVNGGWTGWENSLLEVYPGDNPIESVRQFYYDKRSEWLFNRMTSFYGSPYTYVVLITEESHTLINGPISFDNNFWASGQANTLEEAEYKAERLAQDIEFGLKNHPNPAYYAEYVHPSELEDRSQDEVLDQSKGKALGHYKDKAQGKALGHKK